MSLPDRGGPPFPAAGALLDKYGLRAKKHFGQNFLTSERVFRAIVDATVRTDDEWVVEIGAGLDQRLIEHRHDVDDVGARRQLGHHAAVGSVHVVLRRDHVGQRAHAVLDHRRGGLVARALEAEHPHHLLPRSARTVSAASPVGCSCKKRSYAGRASS